MSLKKILSICIFTVSLLVLSMAFKIGSSGRQPAETTAPAGGNGKGFKQ